MPIPRIDNLEGVPTVQGAVVFRSIHALMNGGRLTDDDGNKFRVTQFNFAQSNASRAYVTKHTRNNVFVAHWQVPLTDEYKHDFVGLDYSGSDLLVLGTGHDTVNPERLYESCEAVIPGVFVNRGGGLLPGRGGASVPLPAPEPQEEEVDYARILTDMAAALNDTNHPLSVAMKKMVKNNSKIAAGEALDDSYATTNGSFYRGNGPFKRFQDTVWEQVHKVLTERGLGTPPPPGTPTEAKDGE